MNDDETHQLVALLVARAGFPASDDEVAALADGAAAVQAAVARLYAVPLAVDTEPGVVFRAR